jgi:hypothetical protein
MFKVLGSVAAQEVARPGPAPSKHPPVEQVLMVFSLLHLCQWIGQVGSRILLSNLNDTCSHNGDSGMVDFNTTALLSQNMEVGPAIGMPNM